MNDKPALCPLSFGFNLKQQAPNIIDPKKVDVHIQVGFPCIKEKCHFYYVLIQDCVIWEILKKVEEVLDRLEEA